MSKCSREAVLLTDYINQYLAGKKVTKPIISDKNMQQLMVGIDRLVNQGDRMAGASKRVLGAVGSLSNFDVKLAHMSTDMMKFADSLSDLSESNLAIVEETTATMGQVNENIDLTTNTLQTLAQGSDSLAAKNNESQSVLQQVDRLKENVLNDAQNLKNNMEELAGLVSGIEDIVESVQQIATQTNLLSLNASIEAARAGEQGRGFAVVADEVRNLADSTKAQLEYMREFVTKIYEASQNGNQAMDRALGSINQMSEKIDNVNHTVGENIEMLKEVTGTVADINEKMLNIRHATVEVNKAMEQCSSDAEKLTHMTKDISIDAKESVTYAKSVSHIDDDLAETISYMYKGIDEGISMIANQDLLEVIEKAKEAHIAWIEKLSEMVNVMQVGAVQTKANKCMFGHFYYVIRLKHPSVAQEWKSIDKVHEEFHAQGKKAIEAIERSDENAARSALQTAVNLSDKLMSILDDIEAKIKQLDARGENVV